MDTYKIPLNTSIGHVHLKVSDLDKSLDFYVGILGFEITERMGDQVVFISAGGYHHHIALNTWYSKEMAPASEHSIGLFHVAILYPTRRDLSVILKRLIDYDRSVLTGASDHGVSEAIYLNDPDGNGIELYWDRPKEQWPRASDGSLRMYTRHLDVQELLGLANE